jgi:predicted permease
MTTVREACTRLISVFRKHSLDAEFDDEIREHIELAAEDYERQGLPADEARRLARVKFGGIDVSKEVHRDTRGLAWLEGLFHDLRLAVRGLARDRGYTITAIAMLALAIGLNVTAYVVMNTVLFRGFPLVKRNDRLVYIQEMAPTWQHAVSYRDFEDWRTQTKTLQGMAMAEGAMVLFRDRGGSGDERLQATNISPNTFSLLGVRPILGRDFAERDDMPGAARVAILSYALWQQRFAGNGDVVGRVVSLDREPATVIGVMPERFGYPARTDMWMPLVRTPAMQDRAMRGYMAMGRLADGVTREELRTEMRAVAQRLADAYPETNRGVTPHLETHSEFFIGPDSKIIYGSMWAATWFVLLIAFANLANLTLARTFGRSRELSTRIALGAGRWRMMRLLVAESAILACAGGVLGWRVARAAVAAYVAATASPFQVLDYQVDFTTAAYLAGVAIAGVILFGLAPAARVLGMDLNGMLKGGARGIHGKRLTSMLVAVQVALAIVLLSGAGVLVRSFLKFQTADTGIVAKNLLDGAIDFPAARYATADSRVALYDRLRARLESIPGVEEAAVANRRPVDGSDGREFELWGDRQVSRDGARPVASTLAAGPDYFRVVGARTLGGREFGAADNADGPPVAIVNHRFVAKYMAGQDALGKRLRLVGGGMASPWMTVVGVVSNIVQDDRTRQEYDPLVYLPMRDQPAASGSTGYVPGNTGSVWFFVRTRVAPVSVAAAVRSEIPSLDANLRLRYLGSMEETLRFQGSRMDPAHQDMGKNSVLTPIFAAIALLLASVGLYAVLAWSVSQRTKEIGVRMAIGAAARDIRRMVFGEGMPLVATGLIVGVAVSLEVNRFLQSQLVGVSPYDPVTLVVGPVILLAVAIPGCQIPARRAMRVDPAVALREE